MSDSETQEPVEVVEPVEEETTVDPQLGEETGETDTPAAENQDEDQDQDQDNDNDVDPDANASGDNEILDYGDVVKLKARKRRTVGDQPAEPLRRAETADNDNDNTSQMATTNESLDAATKRRQALEEKFERALKRPKVRRRKDEHDLTNDDDEMVQILKQQMDSAAKKDAELIENGTGVAMNKVQLLPKVSAALSKVNLSEVILDNNLLAEIRQWLEPLPDASLPSYEIQKTLFTALLKLPINTNHLRESGIGKILLFYQKSKRVEPKIKRVADKLISDWTRPIIGASDNYRDMAIHSVDFDARKLKAKASKPRRLTKEELAKREAEKSIYEQQAARRNRAAAPAPSVSDYKFAPVSRVDRSSQSIASAGVGSSLNRDDQFKRINQKLSRGGRTSTKKGGISIEGRGLGGL